MRERFAADHDVSRETLDKFELYAAMLTDWQSRMNLVGPATLSDIWGRHFADSAQLAGFAPHGASWLDVGAGAGFPGIVLALLGHGPVHLIEATTKKTAFLAAVVEALGLAGRAMVVNARIERMPALSCDVITARACAPLARLFEWGARHAAPGALWVLPKGASYSDEIEIARRTFDFTHELADSRTHPDSRIVLARNVVARR